MNKLFILPVPVINAYRKEDFVLFMITGTEKPQPVPSWLWVLIIGAAGGSQLYYWL